MASTAASAATNGNGMMIRMSDYSYELKESSIAKYPASPRGSSKLVRVQGDGKMIWYDHFAKAFPKLAKDCHLVLNDSHVMDARLFVSCKAGSKIELMILDLGNIDLTLPCKDVVLRAMIRTDQVKAGEELNNYSKDNDNSTGSIKIRIEEILGIWHEDEKSDGNGLDCFVRILTGDYTVEEFLNKEGTVPIPPYFQREAEQSDREAYNNVYADDHHHHNGNGDHNSNNNNNNHNHIGSSVAAPTAGLHFTKELLDEHPTKSFLTLHVGAGTFQPVWKENAAQHDMHAEYFCVSAYCLKQLALAEKPLLVVGTTSCRTLESLYWCGVKRILQGQQESKDDTLLELDQFEWQSLASKANNITYQQAFQALVDDSATTTNSATGTMIIGRTRLMICTGYQFRVVNHLITNFHAPDSTLMLLVTAFLDSSKAETTTIKQVYQQAQDRGYRFLSYGDVCMFSRPGYSLPGDEMNEY